MPLRLGPLAPRPDVDRRWSVVVRGVVLNDAVLRKELSARGHPSRPESTEEIVRALVEEAGPIATAGRLAGDWWFVATDAHSGERWLIRDALGLGEVAWVEKDGELLVGDADDVAATAGRRAASREALAWWFAAGAVPAPLTWWGGVSALPAGHALRWDGHGAHLQAWHQPPASVAGWGTQRELRRWADGVRGAFQVAVLQRLEGVTAVAQTGDLDGAVVAIAGQRSRGAFPQVPGAEEPVDVDAICKAGPVAPEVAALLPTLLRARSEGHSRVLVGTGGSLMTGWREAGLRDAVAGLLGRRDPRPGVVEEPPRTLPAGWAEAVAASRGAVPHAWGRIVTVRGALAPGLARIGRVAGVEIRAPWISPAVEALCASVPSGLRSPPGRSGALARAAFPEAQAPEPASALPIAPDAVADALDGWVDARAVREALGSRAGSRDPRGWRLVAAAAWRRGGTVS